MRGIGGYIVIGGMAALAASGVLVASVGLAVGARPLIERGGIVQHVDRTLKADRLDIRTRIGKEPVPKTQTAPAGCDTVFSRLSTAPKNPAGRCVA
jgi:hypothetical protein